MAVELAKVFNAESAESGHPNNGERPVPDELAEIVANLIALSAGSVAEGCMKNSNRW